MGDQDRKDDLKDDRHVSRRPPSLWCDFIEDEQDDRDVKHPCEEKCSPEHDRIVSAVARREPDECDPEESA